MTGWLFLYLYIGGSAAVALYIGWHILFRLDKYDRQYSEVWAGFWLGIIFWPFSLLLLWPGKLHQLIHPTFHTHFWNTGKAEKARELDRLALNLLPCGASIRYAPERDESGACNSEFVFDAAEVESVIATRLADLPAEQHGHYDTILNWLLQRDHSQKAPSDVPRAWHRHFLNVAVGMMNRRLGQVKCGECDDFIPQDQISIDSGPMNMVTSGWAYSVWRCPQGHKLLTKDAMHFYISRAD